VVFVLMRIAKRQERERIAALLAERRAALAAAGLGLAPSDAALPAALASARAFDKADAVRLRAPNPPLAGSSFCHNIVTQAY